MPSVILPSFLSRPAGAVGIDIGTYSTKIVELQYQGDRAHLSSYGEFPSGPYLKGGTAGIGLLRFPDTDIVNLLKESLREAGVAVKNAILSIPASASFITLINLPVLSPKEIEQTIPFEARKYVPMPISEVVLDWEITEKEGGKEVEALMVAVPRELVEKMKRVATSAGLSPVSFEVETFSGIRALLEKDRVPTAIVNIGNLSTTLAVAEEGKMRFSSSFAHGSLELTRALEGGLGISKERAEDMKRELGLSEKAEEKEITSVMQPMMAVLFLEIERALSLYHRRANRKVQKTVLSGAGAELKGMVDYASTRLKMEVKRGNPFIKISAPPTLEPALQEIGPSFAVAVGLALREFTSH